MFLVLDRGVGAHEAFAEQVLQVGEAAKANLGRVAVVRVERYPRIDVLVEVEGEPDAIERAKGVLMEVHGMRESEAFHRIRKTSMDARKSMKEVSEAILLAHEMGHGLHAELARPRGVLEQMLQIGDVRSDKRIDFVGGARGTKALEDAVDSGRAAVAFSMFAMEAVSCSRLVARVCRNSSVRPLRRRLAFSVA